MSSAYNNWFNLGCKRIQNILNRYVACTARQFEMKITEAGPYNQRVEPLILRTCLRYMVAKGDLVQDVLDDREKTIVYYFPNTDGRKLVPRLKLLAKCQDDYIQVTQEARYVGYVLERSIGIAINDNLDIYHSFLPSFENTTDGVIPKKDCDTEIKYLNGLQIFNNSTLDGILIHKSTSIPIGIEIKNKREWKYPSDFEIWNMIAKCVTLELFPIFVARKIPTITKFFFAKVGILGLETQFQFIHSSQQNNLKNVVHKEKLGYSDIKFSEEPMDYVKKFFRQNIPNHIEEYYAKFLENKDILYEYAIEAQLFKSSIRNRHRIYKEFRDRIYEEDEIKAEIETYDY